MSLAQFSPETLSAARISPLPDSFFYIPNFISGEEESYILQKLPAKSWHTLHHRRLQAHPSTLAGKSHDVLLAAPLPPWLVSTPPILERFKDLGIFIGTKHGAPNHCLVNEYKPGEGIMPHEDGGAYSPVVATVSLGGMIVLDIYEKGQTGEDTQRPGTAPSDGDQRTSQKPKWRILQPPRSLLVTVDPAYTCTKHGIDNVEVDEDLGPETVANWELLEEEDRTTIQQNQGRSERSLRVSLTYRDVLKVNAVVGLGGRR
ncbi:hypothetical protein K402DRAFT_393462 [Aulographum hederae CBS 113979]|uniref:Fe2OG dioxygenase domain-containing protein n=1 Tax=Aulographum hederae CBS 113979 TaxID=1176131 RepID=A0A6G1H195_9PEZI|nr:hypothetical protein K402DRAFT_393462 [Aulographum hederae CBS 113979]